MSSRRVALQSIENSLISTPRTSRKDLREALPKKNQNESSVAPIFHKTVDQRKSGRSSIYSLFDDEVPEELSTFFESSTVENPVVKYLKSVPGESTSIFPGDDIFRDVPWIAVPSPTYKRKRPPSPVKRCEDSDTSETSTDTASEEIEIVHRPSPRKRRKLVSEEPGVKEWIEKFNAELAEVDKHELTVEET
ncbi:uncharacterized protein LOC100900129 [Galendromus occidentalis]|uniref:Uncharacterized protein LOC100900129 n=1 Tax=Galendromus occidentalis TaxID=34638 RepID=A0AAJ6QUX8_9ACAR|nr:uncharacterized protein LOC100900129 [Galendromus occidentalis]